MPAKFIWWMNVQVNYFPLSPAGLECELIRLVPVLAKTCKVISITPALDESNIASSAAPHGNLEGKLLLRDGNTFVWLQLKPDMHSCLLILAIKTIQIKSFKSV